MDESDILDAARSYMMRFMVMMAGPLILILRILEEELDEGEASDEIFGGPEA